MCLSITPRHPRTTLFPYTTLFRSGPGAAAHAGDGAWRDRFHDQAVQSKAAVRPGGRFGLNGLVMKSVDRKSTRLNSSHLGISYAVFCLKKKKKTHKVKYSKN